MRHAFINLYPPLHALLFPLPTLIHQAIVPAHIHPTDLEVRYRQPFRTLWMIKARPQLILLIRIKSVPEDTVQALFQDGRIFILLLAQIPPPIPLRNMIWMHIRSRIQKLTRQCWLQTLIP